MSWLFTERLSSKYSLFAPESNSWWGLCCCSSPYRYVMAGGNVTGTGIVVTAERYTPSAAAWATVTSMPTPGRRDPYYGTIGDDVYLSNGAQTAIPVLRADNDKYNHPGDIWTSMTDGPVPARSGGTGGLVYNQYFFMVTGSIGVAGYITDTSKFDSVGNSWSASTAIPTTGRTQVCIASVGNYGFVTGGRTSVGGPVNEYNFNDIFDFSSETWSSGTLLADDRASMSPIPQGGNNYIASGLKTDLDTLNTDVLKYDIAGSTWVAKTAIPNSRSFAPGVSDLANIVSYVYGGSGGTNTHRAYTDDVWTSLANGLSIRQAAGVG